MSEEGLEEPTVDIDAPDNDNASDTSERLKTADTRGLRTPANDGGVTGSLQRLTEDWPTVPPGTGPPTPMSISTSRPYTPSNEIGFTPERAQEMVVWATPRYNDNLRIRQEQVLEEVLHALGEKCPFPVSEMYQIGAGKADTMVRKYEEHLEVVAVVTGLSSAGCVEYRAPFIDFILEYLRCWLKRQE